MSEPSVAPSQPYGIQLLDDLHMVFPAILYEPERFTTVNSLLQYVSMQAREHGNRFNRAQREYQTPPRRVAQPAQPPSLPPRQSARTRVLPSTPVPGVPNLPMNIVTETYDLTNLLNIPNLHVGPPQQTSGILSNFLNLLTTMDVETAYSLDPVIVRPTNQQIENATGLRSAEPIDESAVCSVCQDHYTEGQAIRTISHCQHSFHKNCIDQWFERDVHCPVCRFDIRE